MFAFDTTEAELRKHSQGLLIAVLMYRLGINEITIDVDDIKAVEHTFGANIMDLLVANDPFKRTLSFKLVPSK